MFAIGTELLNNQVDERRQIDTTWCCNVSRTWSVAFFENLIDGLTCSVIANRQIRSPCISQPAAVFSQIFPVDDTRQLIRLKLITVRSDVKVSLLLIATRKQDRWYDDSRQL